MTPATPSMTSQPHHAPNAIPPRRSSTGYTSHNMTEAAPSKSGLETVQESAWIAPIIGDGSDKRRSDSSSTSNAIDPALAQNGNLLSAYSSKFPTFSPSNHQREASGGRANGVNDDGSKKEIHSQQDFEAAANKAIHENGSTWSEDKERILLGPFNYMYDHPGKDIRKQLIAAFNAWLKVPEKSLQIITKAVGMLHTASLLVDDVEDFSLLRRGVPVAHSLFGTAQTINSANYVYFAALQELSKLNNAKAIQIYTQELCNLHRGQGMDLYWRESLTCPTEQDYLEMVGNKTGGLFRLAVLLMQAESRSQKDFLPLVNTIGLLFQIRDDYMNLASPSYTETKGLCEDLTEGKFSFPIIHSIRSNPSNLQLINILRQKTTDVEVKRYAVSYMEKTGSFEYCRRKLRQLQDMAKEMIDGIDEGRGDGRGVRAFLDKMVV